MAKQRQRKFTIRFELGIKGMLGLATVCLCIFLWLFLLGVWAGQTVLLPTSDSSSGQALQSFAQDIWQRGRQAVEDKAPQAKAAPASSTPVGQLAIAPLADDEEEEPSFFTLQVATYDEEGDAKQEVVSWQAKGHDSFFLPPMEGADHFRVFIGRFSTLSQANDLVNDLDKDQQIRAFITLLPAHNVGR